jgi:hypothetical protein
VDDAKIRLTVPRLDYLQISGNSDADLRDLRGRFFAVNIAGSGAVKASGRVERLKIEISGSADIEMPRMDAAEASVEVSGSGNVSVGRTEKLDVDVSGSGNLTYRGRPQVSQRISGSGSVEAADS